MTDWVQLGGGNSGCCGNSLHLYGFHLPATAIPVTDYSRSHESAPPYNMSWACAGDFGHNNTAALRARHATVLARLMANDPALSMICEFIGKPYADKPVYYWARWDGVGTLQQYTGAGHDTWSHISWWRSRANQRAYLWTTAAPAPVTPGSTYPPYPGYLLSYNPAKFDGNVKLWQTQMKVRGVSITADGYFGPATRAVVLAFQKQKGLTVDGLIGPVTWAAAWAA